jgi:hypothetical protein
MNGAGGRDQHRIAARQVDVCHAAPFRARPTSTGRFDSARIVTAVMKCSGCRVIATATVAPAHKLAHQLGFDLGSRRCRGQAEDDVAPGRPARSRTPPASLTRAARRAGVPAGRVQRGVVTACASTGDRADRVLEVVGSSVVAPVRVLGLRIHQEVVLPRAPGSTTSWAR